MSQSSVGATYSYAAPTGLVGFMRLRGYKDVAPTVLPEQRRNVAELDALEAEVDALKRLQAETAAELDALLPALLDRALTHSPPARSGVALSLREIRLARSQRARLKGEL